jgi:hypothetical protein
MTNENGDFLTKDTEKRGRKRKNAEINGKERKYTEIAERPLRRQRSPQVKSEE